MVDTRKLKNFEFGNATDVGRVREQNEDYLGYFECINGHIFVVCDGMGGHVGGATASRLAVEAAREFLENHYYDLPQDALKDAIEYANEAVYIKAAENPQLQGMGTTIVMVIVRDDKAYYAHVGDSRLYLHSGGKLIKLTRDHSFVQTLVDQGLLKEEEMESHPRRNEILRALGVRNDIEISICKSPAKPTNGDILLLCTDGLNSMITDSVTESVLNEDISIQHKALKLMQLANDAGGYDNITVQLVHFYNVTNKKSDFIPASQVPVDEPVLNDSKKKFKLTKKMRKNILYVVVGIAVLAIAYFMWDMFGGGGKPDPMTVGGKDTVKTQTADSVHQPGAPVENAVVKVSNDTIWADYEVKSGDVLGKICTKFNVKLAILKKKNKLKSDNVKVGDKLWVPVKAEHVVASGETIDGIAKKYESEKTAILTANGLKSPTDMKVGKTLLVPYTR